MGRLAASPKNYFAKRNVEGMARLRGAGLRGKVKHGKSKDPLHGRWITMKSRCNNPNHISFKNYGARGIYVSPQWEVSFVNFLRDMGPSWEKGKTLDRIDKNGPYVRWNCRWATISEQNRDIKNINIINIETIIRKTIEELFDKVGGNFYELGKIMVEIYLNRQT